MKKLVFLITIICSVSLLNAYRQDYYCEDDECTNDAEYCKRCCAQGRWASEECLRRCNSCYPYNDEAKAEYNDATMAR